MGQGAPGGQHQGRLMRVPAKSWMPGHVMPSEDVRRESAKWAEADVGSMSLT
jgi:hypothetical protein